MSRLQYKSTFASNSPLKYRLRGFYSLNRTSTYDPVQREYWRSISILFTLDGYYDNFHSVHWISREEFLFPHEQNCKQKIERKKYASTIWLEPHSKCGQTAAVQKFLLIFIINWLYIDNEYRIYYYCSFAAGENVKNIKNCFGTCFRGLS